MSRAAAILLGAHHPSALAVMRSLGPKGVPIVAVDEDPAAIGFRSRYVAARHVVRDEAAVLALLERLGETHRGAILVATTDRYLRLISESCERLSPALVPTVPPWSVLGPLMRKPESYALAAEIGLQTPRHFTIAEAAELDRTLASLDLAHHDYLLSMADVTIQNAVADERTGRSVMVAAAQTAAIRDQCLDIHARTGHFPMIVEVVPGASEASIGVTLVMDRDQRVVRAYGLRRLPFHLRRPPPRFIHPYDLGWNVRCESACDPPAFEAATALVRRAGYFGVVTVEFRRDARDGQLVLVKLDPRVERATALSAAIGLDVPRAIYAIFAEGEILPPPARFPTGVRWLWLTWGLDTLWDNRARVSIARELLALARDLPRIRASAFLSARDPAPFLVDVGRWVRCWTKRGAVWLQRRVRATTPRAAEGDH